LRHLEPGGLEAPVSHSGSSVIAGIDYGRLPRGRHGIPKEEVLANQRERLLAAATVVFAEQGYASLAITAVIARAGVSRSTFYKFFDDKLDCVLAAQRRAVEALGQTIAWACTAEQDWPCGVARGVGAAIAFTARFPGEARLVLASGQVASEPALARQGLPAHERLIELLHEGSQRHPGTRSPSGLAEQAAVGAAMSIVASFLAVDEIDALAERKADLIEIVLTPYLGGEEAKHAALAS
jgi:AcrR family transcriptional regulator